MPSPAPSIQNRCAASKESQLTGSFGVTVILVAESKGTLLCLPFARGGPNLHTTHCGQSRSSWGVSLYCS